MAPKKGLRKGHRIVLSMIADLARPSLSLDNKQTVDVAKLAIAMQEFLDEEALALVQQAGEQPIMQYYSSDGTPIKTHLKAHGGGGWEDSAQGRERGYGVPGANRLRSPLR